MRTQSFVRVALALPYLAVPSLAQTTTVWQANLPNSTSPRVLRVDASGEVVVAGVIGVPTDTLVAKYDVAGALLWSRTFDGQTGNDEVRDMAIDASGGVYVVGVSRNPGTFYDSGLLLHYDAAGTLLWSRPFAPDAIEAEGGGVVLDGQGGVYVTGSIWSASGGIALWKYDTDGNLAFSSVANLPGVLVKQPAAGCRRDANGDIVATAVAAVPTGDTFVAARFDASGAPLWARSFTPAGYNYVQPRRLALDAQGALYSVGTCAVSSDPTHHDGLLVKYDTDGTHAWTRFLIGAPGLDDGYGGVAVDPAGDVIVVGAYSVGNQTIALAQKYDAQGNRVWSTPHAGGDTSSWSLNSVALDDGGNVTALGGANDGGIDAVLMRFDTGGAKKWLQRLDAGAVDLAGSVALDADAIVCTTLTDGHIVTRRLQPLAQTFCFGNGAGAACPCGNESAPYAHAGCRNSTGDGARLADLGIPRLSADTLRLAATDLTGAIALFFQGTSAQAGGSGTPFGDGLQCAGGSIRRLGTRSISLGTTEYPGAGNPPVSVVGLVTTPAQRVYQTWYRNAASFCTAATFNLSNGVRVTWVP